MPAEKQLRLLITACLLPCPIHSLPPITHKPRHRHTRMFIHLMNPPPVVLVTNILFPTGFSTARTTPSRHCTPSSKPQISNLCPIPPSLKAPQNDWVGRIVNLPHQKKNTISLLTNGTDWGDYLVYTNTKSQSRRYSYFHQYCCNDRELFNIDEHVARVNQ